MNLIYFASSNENKFIEIQNLCRHENTVEFEIIFEKTEIPEIQSESITVVAEDKVKRAFEIIKKPVMVEDDGLFISSLNAFPGVYSSFVFKTIGNEGILKLLSEKDNRSASFLSVISFCDGKNVQSFVGETVGKISREIIPGGWGYDPIFIPENENKTFGQMDVLKKNELSHRSKAFRKFLKWYIKNNK